MRVDKHAYRRVCEGRQTEYLFARRPRLRPGRVVAVEVDARNSAGRLITLGRDAPRVEILRVTEQPLQDVTFTTARRHGYRTRGELLTAWQDRHGAPTPGLVVWLVEFRLVEELRLLAARSQYGYVRSLQEGRVLTREPEAVDAGSQARLTAQAGQWQALRAGQAARDRDRARLDARVRDAARRAAEHRLDVSRELRAITRAVQRMERRLDDRAA